MAQWGHSPDKTYNHIVTLQEVLGRAPSPDGFSLAEVGDWNQNEARSLEMES